MKLKYFDFFQKPDLTSINKKLTKYLGSTTLVTSKQTEALVTMSTDPFVYLSKVLSFDNETVTKFQIVMDVNADHSTTVDCDFHALYEMYPKTTKPKASPSDGLNKWNPAKNKEQATAQLEIDKSKSYVYIWIEGNRKFEPNDASLGELVRAGLLDVFGDEIGEQPSEIAYYYEENKLNAIRVIFPSYSQKVFQFCNVTNEAVSVNN